MTCKNQPEALRLAAQLEDTKSARLPTWQDMLGDAEQLVRQKPTFSKYIRGTVLENDVPVWIADFAQRLLLRELTRFALRAALAEPTCKQSLKVAEQQWPEHIDSPECWCEPELSYKDPETGVEVWVHRDIQ